MKKILALQSALEALGIKTELNMNDTFYCLDRKFHNGIRLGTNFPIEDDCLEFIFHPQTFRFVKDCKELPLAPNKR